MSSVKHETNQRKPLYQTEQHSDVESDLNSSFKQSLCREMCRPLKLRSRHVIGHVLQTLVHRRQYEVAMARQRQLTMRDELDPSTALRSIMVCQTPYETLFANGVNAATYTVKAVG